MSLFAVASDDSTKRPFRRPISTVSHMLPCMSSTAAQLLQRLPETFRHHDDWTRCLSILIESPCRGFNLVASTRVRANDLHSSP
jgi:hypothetical protein